jgi:hypothetical protein
MSETGLRYVRPATGTYERPPTLAGAGFSSTECRFFQDGEEMDKAVAAGLHLSEHAALESPAPGRGRMRPGRLSSMILAGLLLLGGLWVTAFRAPHEDRVAESAVR